MEKRLLEIQAEIQNLQKAIEEIDKLIVNTGFRTFTSAETDTTLETTTTEEKESETKAAEEVEPEQDQIRITSKDGTILGTMNIKEHTIIFTPTETFDFALDIPPFQSFLIERVLDNMRKTDQERSTNGELDPGEILNFEVQEQDGILTQLSIQNYGGERRLREINSSLRWTFDKMYDKISQG